MSLLHTAYRVAQTLRLLYWRVFQPDVHGAKTVVIDDQRRVLLIRHSYSKQHLFMLPGGGVGRGEDPALAAAREVREETGIMAHDLRLHGTFLDTAKGARNHISVFAATSPGGDPRVDGREILEAGWFALDDLPANLSSASRARIVEVRDGLPPADRWLP